jgi:uncharacterized repeat protein (TIGR01451 family)
VARSAPGFPLIRASLSPAEQQAGARVRIHLRGANPGEFYRLDLRQTEGQYEAVLPRPGADTAELVYFLEVVGESFPAATTPEFRVPVVPIRADCSGAGALESEGPPGIPVLEAIAAPATLQGPLAGEPPEEPEKKSKKRGAWIAVGAAAGAAVGLGFLSGGSEETPAIEPEPPPEPPEPPSPPPIPPPALVEACFEIPSSERVGASVRIDASCSSPRGSIAYGWRLGDGRTREGRVITPIYRAPGLYIVELTVSRLEPSGEGDVDRLEKPILITEAPTAPPPDGTGPVADIAVSKSGQLTSKIVDGVLEFHIAYTLQVTNLGPNPASTVRLRDALAADLTPTSLTFSTGSCGVAAGVVTCDLGTLTAGGAATVRLEVDVRPGVAENTVVTNTATVQSALGDPAPSNNQATESTVLRRPPPLTTDGRGSWSESTASFVSTLSSPRVDGSTAGTIRIGESYSDIVNDTASFHHRFRSPSESIVVEGVIQRASGEAHWRFDFSSDPRFAPGSIEVQQGEILGIERGTLTFRLVGQPGERIRFSYRQYR